ncbi:MAG: arginase family protein, partial [Sphingomonadales bacterium]
MIPEHFQSFFDQNPAKVVAIGIGIDHNSSYLRGAAKGPNEVRENIYHDAANSWTESGIDLKDKDNFCFVGLLRSDMKTVYQDIETIGEMAVKEKRNPIFVGGDHSITYMLMKGISKVHKDLTILHIDAHPDLYNAYEGNPFSHASPFARIMEEKLAKRLVQYGIRTITGEQRKQIKKFGVETHEMKDWRGIPELKFDGPVYMSIDMDGLDPSCAPGVSHREPGGLTTREVLSMI